MSKKFLDIQDQHSKIFGHRILNSQLSLYLGILQLIVCLWSLTQHLFSMLVLNTILHCDFSSNSTLPALLTSVDAIIFDFGLFHSLWGIDGCVAQHLDGGYGRFVWCITHSTALIFCLPFAFANRPKPYYLWPLLIQQSAYGIGLLILSLAALPRVLPTFMGDLSNAPIHAIFFYATGTLMNFFLLYIYWHWYWFVEAQWDSARKIRSSQLQNSHNSRSGSLHGCHRLPINNKYLISEFTDPLSEPDKELPTNGLFLSNGHAFSLSSQNGSLCLGQKTNIRKVSALNQKAITEAPSEIPKRYSISPTTSSCCSQQSSAICTQVKAVEAICSGDGGSVQQQVVRQPRKFPVAISSSPASSQTSGMQPVLPVQVSKLRKEGRRTSGMSSRKSSSTSRSSAGSGGWEGRRRPKIVLVEKKKKSAGAGQTKQGERNGAGGPLVKQPQLTRGKAKLGTTNMGTQAIQRQRQQPTAPRILPTHLPSSLPVHPIVHSSWLREEPLYGQQRQYRSFSQASPIVPFHPQTSSSCGFYANGHTFTRTPPLSLQPIRRIPVKRSAESYNFDHSPILIRKPEIIDGWRTSLNSSGPFSSVNNMVMSNTMGWNVNGLVLNSYSTGL